MNKLISITCLGSLMLATGCANFSPLVTQRAIPQNGPHLVTYDSSRRGTLFTVVDGKVTAACAEPAPDTAYNFSNAFKASGKGGKTPAEVSVDVALTATALQLAGRDNLVLLTREAMFRLCEAQANNFLGNPAYAAQFQTILQQITTIADTKKAEAEDNAARTNALLGANIMTQMLEATKGTKPDDK
jgi:hypothetical protein